MFREICETARKALIFIRFWIMERAEIRLGTSALSQLCFYGRYYVRGSLPSVARYPIAHCKDRGI